MQLKEKKILMEKDKRKLESELERQRQTISKQVFLQVVQKKGSNEQPTTTPETMPSMGTGNENMISVSSTAMVTTSDSNTHHNHQQIANNNNNNKHRQINSNTLRIDKETPRRQWDKTQNFIDLENEKSQLPNGITTAPSDQINHVNNNARASSTSSMSTPSSSASQSPPLSNLDRHHTQKNANGENFDLSKAYYSRDEMLKTIDTLKEKYEKDSSVTAAIVTQAGKNLASTSSANSGSSTTMVKDIDSLNSKLSELQNEITRLTLLQQKQNIQKSTTTTTTNDTDNLETTKTATNNNKNSSFNLFEQRKNVTKLNNETSEEQNNIFNNNTNSDVNDDENMTGMIFVCFQFIN